jgi:hypothetical protein
MPSLPRRSGSRLTARDHGSVGNSPRRTPTIPNELAAAKTALERHGNLSVGAVAMR